MTCFFAAGSENCSLNRWTAALVCREMGSGTRGSSTSGSGEASSRGGRAAGEDGSIGETISFTETRLGCWIRQRTKYTYQVVQQNFLPP